MTSRANGPEPVVETLLLEDDGLVPNNGRLPLLVYRGVLDVGGADAERAVLSRFAANGWAGGWVNGIYDFQHYHSNAHEVLGLVRGSPRVQLGGPKGPIVYLAAGDAVVIPAGVGHCRLSREPISVVGAYPEGQHDVDLRRATPADRAASLPRLAKVGLPECDPVLGAAGPLLRHWSKTPASAIRL
jgi:uncharacterized protein YjlB